MRRSASSAKTSWCVGSRASSSAPDPRTRSGQPVSSLVDVDASDASGPSGLKYRRVVLKLNSEAVQGDASSPASSPIDHDVLDYMARQVSRLVALGVQVAIVIGGGNIWRGEAASSRGMERATADYMGMLATVINGLALQASLERHGQHTRVQSA